MSAFQCVLENGQKTEVERGSHVILERIEVLSVVEGWHGSIGLRGEYNEELSASIWDADRKEPHSESVQLQVDGGCKIVARGAKIRIFGKKIRKGSPPQVRRSLPKRQDDDDGCVLL